MPRKQSLIEDKADKLCDTFCAFIYQKIEDDFQTSTSTTPGLRKRLEDEHQYLFDMIANFQKDLALTMEASEISSYGN